MHALSKHETTFQQKVCVLNIRITSARCFYFFIYFMSSSLAHVNQKPNEGDEDLKINGAEEPTTWFMDALWNQKSKEKVEISSFVFAPLLGLISWHHVQFMPCAVHATYTLLTRAWHFKAYSYVKHMGSQTDRGLFEWFLIKWKTGKKM